MKARLISLSEKSGAPVSHFVRQFLQRALDGPALHTVSLPEDGE